MSKLEENTTALDEVLAMVNALPDAGSGGGGTSLDVGTLTGVTTLLAAPDETTFYYDLESIPNYSTKKMIAFFYKFGNIWQMALLTRDSTNSAFELTSLTGSGSIYEFSIVDTVLSVNTIMSFDYYAV